MASTTVTSRSGLDRNANSLGRLRRNMQRLATFAASTQSNQVDHGLTSTQVLALSTYYPFLPLAGGTMNNGAIVSNLYELEMFASGGGSIVMNGAVLDMNTGSGSGGGTINLDAGTVNLDSHSYMKGDGVGNWQVRGSNGTITGNALTLSIELFLPVVSSDYIDGGVGSIWYNSSTGFFKGRQSTHTVDFITDAPQGSTLVLAGPSTGASATPTWRKLSTGDISGISTALPYLPLAGGTMSGAILTPSAIEFYTPNGNSTAECFLLQSQNYVSTNLFPVAMFSPSTETTGMVVDIVPRGNPTNNSNTGAVCWIDLASIDYVDNPSSFQGLRLGAGTSYNQVGGAAFNSGSVLPLAVNPNGNNIWFGSAAQSTAYAYCTSSGLYNQALIASSSGLTSNSTGLGVNVDGSTIAIVGNKLTIGAQAVFPVIATIPAVPLNGQAWYYSTGAEFLVYVGSTFQLLNTGAGAVNTTTSTSNTSAPTTLWQYAFPANFFGGNTVYKFYTAGFTNQSVGSLAKTWIWTVGGTVIASTAITDTATTAAYEWELSLASRFPGSTGTMSVSAKLTYSGTTNQVVVLNTPSITVSTTGPLTVAMQGLMGTASASDIFGVTQGYFLVLA